MTGAPIVRTATLADSSEIARLLEQLGYERDPHTIEDDLHTGAAGEVFVAMADSRVVGLLSMSIYRQLHHGSPVAGIETLVVDREARSAGIGSALVDTAVQRARHAGCALVELHSNLERVDARRFYERHGFVVTSNYFVRALT